MTELAADSFRAVGSGDAVHDHSAVPFYVADRRLRVCVVRVDHQLYAFDDLCPCAEPACPLSGGLLIGTTIMCQCHGSEFDLGTGAVIHGPASRPLHIYDVQEVGGTVRVRL